MVPGVSSKADLEKLLAPYSYGVPSKVYKMRLEQYPTPTSVAAHIVWIALLKGSISGATVTDFGCGNGILATTSLLAGSYRAICIDIDEEIITYAQKILLEEFPRVSYRLILMVGDAVSIELNNVDTVVMNPPFGIAKHNRGLDLKFLENALKNARYVYSLHKYSEGFIKMLEKVKKKMGFDVVWFEGINLEIPMIYERHRRRVYRIKVVFVGLAKY